MFFETIGRKILFLLDPENAHELAIKALKSGLFTPNKKDPDPRLRVSLAGLDLPNPLGLAAGFDKNAQIPNAMLDMGFGFVEVGTVTPLSALGNPKPRIFRLEADEGLVNRLGFNNAGHMAVEDSLKRRPAQSGIVGVNLGANRDSLDRIADYESGIKRFSSLADYLTINISSPNTPGLRDLQNAENLDELLTRIISARNEVISHGFNRPLFLKISPDLLREDLENIALKIKEKEIDGIIVSNTTIHRERLKTPSVCSYGAGGLSGKPLFIRSTAVLAYMRHLLGEHYPIIGVGGIHSAETALEKIRAGADAIQIYTGLIYGGPFLPQKILAGMSLVLKDIGAISLKELRDSRLDYWLDQAIGQKNSIL